MKFARLLKVCLVLGLAMWLSTPVSAITTYDGTYRVDATTDEGDCQKTGSGTVTVVNGIIVETSDSSVSSFGRIDENGIASFGLRRGTDAIHVSGRLKGGRFQGAWSAPSQLCGGRWSAQKIH